MKRLILIGNGFDLAHNLKTSYKHFLSDYWSNVLDSVIHTRQNHRDYKEFNNNQVAIGRDMKVYLDVEDSLDFIRNNLSLISFKNEFLKQITEKQCIKNWVDIEFEYFENLKKVKSHSEKLKQLNSDFNEIKCLLIEYLKKVSLDKEKISSKIKRQIEKLIYEEFSARDMIEDVIGVEFSRTPDEILLLSFNYICTESIYLEELNAYRNVRISTIHIHGTLDNESSNPLIFGYGDEIDDEYIELEKLNNTSCLDFIKSISYLDSANYKNLIRFINSDFYQILIMGHSCGISDRTLLNTIFEHEHCCSIKPYYYKIDEQNDNFSDLIKNISRSFRDKAIMRERVVNKTFTKTLLSK